MPFESSGVKTINLVLKSATILEIQNFYKSIFVIGAPCKSLYRSALSHPEGRRHAMDEVDVSIPTFQPGVSETDTGMIRRVGQTRNLPLP